MASRKSMEVRTDDGETLQDRYPFRHSLDTGDRGVLVMWAQARLMNQEHYDGPLDGRYDREVTLAVRKYQEAQGLKITGVIDRRTWECLSGS